MNYSIPSKEEAAAYNYGQIMFDTLEEGIAKANIISKDLLCSISVWKRSIGKNKGKFFIFRHYKDDQKCHDMHQMLVTNYEAPFEVHSISPKSGEHWDSFATKERAKGYYNELVDCGYRKGITCNF